MLAVTKGILTWNTNYYLGPNNPVIGTLPSGGERNLFDSTMQFAVNDKFSVYVNGDYARNNNPVGGGHTSWFGTAFATRYQLTKKGAVAGRVEYFKDPQGFATGVAQNLEEATLTGEYKFNGILLSRVELRRDQSNKLFFNDGPLTHPLVPGMTTLTMGLVATLGPWK
jgi:hypothetical protein